MHQTTVQPVDQLVAHLFRHQSGRLAAVLTRRLGPHRIDMIEDIVQETLVRALRQWPFRGIPANPEAWLMHTASHLLVDSLRRERTFAAKEPQIIAEIESAALSPHPDAVYEQEIQDDQLLMMFAPLSPVPTVAGRRQRLCSCSGAGRQRSRTSVPSEAARHVPRAASISSPVFIIASPPEAAIFPSSIETSRD